MPSMNRSSLCLSCQLRHDGGELFKRHEFYSPSMSKLLLMKFMKLGSKPDSFQTDGDNIRYVATDLATDIVINVGDVKFYLHKIWPPQSVKDLGSHLHSKLKEAIMQTSMEKNLFGNHPVSLPVTKSSSLPPAFDSDPFAFIFFS